MTLASGFEADQAQGALPIKAGEDVLGAVGVSGAWRFAKEETVSDAGALIGAAGFGACGFAASLSVYWNHFGAWAYLPWIAACARSWFPRAMK